MKNSDILYECLENIKDDMDTYDLLELGNVKDVLGEDNYWTIYSIINELSSDDKLILLSAMDKLLNSKKQTISFEEGTVFREESPLDKRRDYENAILESNLSDAFKRITYNLELDDYSLLINVFDIIFSSQSVEDTQKEFEQLPKSVDFVLDNRSKIIDMLNSIDKITQDKLDQLKGTNEDEQTLEILKIISDK
mgnify:CR=1 FL=1